MIVTENVGTDDDQQRINYITTALEGLQRCIDDGLISEDIFIGLS